MFIRQLIFHINLTSNSCGLASSKVAISLPVSPPFTGSIIWLNFIGVGAAVVAAAIRSVVVKDAVFVDTVVVVVVDAVIAAVVATVDATIVDDGVGIIVDSDAVDSGSAVEVRAGAYIRGTLDGSHIGLTGACIKKVSKVEGSDEGIGIPLFLLPQYDKSHIRQATASDQANHE